MSSDLRAHEKEIKDINVFNLPYIVSWFPCLNTFTLGKKNGFFSLNITVIPLGCKVNRNNYGKLCK